MRRVQGYIIRRVLATVPIIIALSVAVFLMMHLAPGDPITVMFQEVSGTPEQMEKLRRQLGLDAPLHVQYLRFAGRLLSGDLGASIWSGQPVGTLIAQSLPHTLQLTAAATLVAVILGGVSGIVAAVFRHSWLDSVSMFVALLGVSMPSFWLSLLLILAFAVNLGWFPVMGEGSVRHVVLPAVALGFSGAAILARMTRSGLIEALAQDYIRTARAKGLAERVTVFKHALRNALIPVITVVGLQVGNLMAGSVIVETVFARRGIGRLLIDAIRSHDFPVAQGTVFFVAVVYVLINLFVDVLFAYIDPRIRYG